MENPSSSHQFPNTQTSISTQGKIVRPFTSKVNKNTNAQFNKSTIISTSINNQQSPKISSNKFRSSYMKTDSNVINKSLKNKLNQKIFKKLQVKKPLHVQLNSNDIYEHKLFSLSDINDKVTNKRGTDLPDQFNIRDPKEIEKLILNGEDPKKIIERTEQINNINLIEKIKQKRLYSAFPSSRNQRIMSTHFHMKCVKDAAINQINKDNNDNNAKNNDENPKRDRWLPDYFEEYQKIVKKPQIIIEDLKRNYKFFQEKLYNFSIKEIKKNANNSDIFMLNPPKNIAINNKQDNADNSKNEIENRKRNIYLSSDIFYNNTQVSNFDKNKSGEKYYFNQVEPKYKFACTEESNSNWETYKNKKFNNINNSNVNYNIIAPNVTNFKASDKFPANNSHNKVKGFAEFNDLTRIPAPNFNFKYQSFINNKGKFNITKGMCNDVIESYYTGKNIYIGKPFSNQKNKFV